MTIRNLIIPLFLVMVLALSLLMSRVENPADTPSHFDAECCEVERDYAANTLQVTQAEGSSIEPRVTVLKHDINTDGKTDFFAKIENPPNCGSSGCEVHLFVAQGDGTYMGTPLFNTAANEFTFTPGEHSPFQNIGVKNGDGETCTWYWAEGLYHFKGCDKR